MGVVRVRLVRATLITVALVLAANPALAGRAGFRAEARTGGFSLRTYLEETAMRIGPFEVTAGVDLRWPPAQATPYTAVIYYGEGYWLALELARPLPSGGWRAAIMGGVSW